MTGNSAKRNIALPITVIALVLVGSLAFMSLNSSAATLDPGLVAVRPFLTTGAGANPALRNDITAMVAAQFDGNGRPRAADVSAVAHAGQVVSGSIDATGDEWTLRASILSVADARLVTATVHASPDSLDAAAAALASRLLDAQKKAR